MIESAVPPDAPRLFRQPAFARFWAARSLSTLAFQITAIVVGWQVFALTGSPLELGFVGLAQFVPMLLLSIPAGHVADRFDRRRVAQVCQMVEALAAALLAAGSAAGRIDTHAVLAAVAVVGAARTFESPTMSALLPGVVNPAELPSALATVASAIQTATILGPAAGGALYLLGPATAYAVVAVLFLAASLSAGSIRISRAPPPREPPSLASLLSGFVFIRDHPIVLGAISLDLFAVLLGGATALLPIYAHDILHTGSVGLGVLRASPAVGALAMSMALARRPLRRNVGRIMFVAVTAFGLGTIVFGLSTVFPLSALALVTMGAADVISVVIRGTLVQLETPDTMRGRVSAVASLFIGTSNQLGEFESGLTATLFGTVPAAVLGGVGTVLVAGAWSLLFPGLRRADRFDVSTTVPPQPLAQRIANLEPGKLKG